MSSQLPLRGYQSEALDAVRAAWSRGVQRPAVVAPTGAGKTVMFAHMIADHLQRHARATTDPAFRFASRAVVLVHCDELADQAIDKINQVLNDPEIRVGKVKATDNDVAADVVVASVQTLAVPGRLAQLLDPDGTDYAPIGLVVVDEAHHAVAPSWKRVMEALGCYTGSDMTLPGPDVVGFSATLARGDEVGLGSVWQEVVYAISLTRLIRRGHLADVRGVQVQADKLDLTGVRRSGGDYSAGALGDALTEAHVPDLVAQAYAAHAADRPGVVFAPTVNTAHESADALNALGIRTEVVTGATPTEERRAMYRRYREGDTQVLANCMVLTEGFDAPWASCAVIARPTQSAPLYTQMVGRVLRPWPGKTDALVLDVVGVTGRHKLATLIDLAPGAVATVRPDQTLAEAVEEAELAAAADEAEREKIAAQSRLTAKDVDLFAQSRNVWLRTKAGVWFIPTREGEFFLWPSAEPGRWDVCHAPVGGPSGYKRLPWERLHVGLSLDLAMSWAQTEAEELDSSVATKDASWRTKGGRASEAQLKMLTRFYRPDEFDASTIRKGQASDMISIGVASGVFDRHYQKVN